MTTITLVKKIMADGTPCRKCAEVEKRLQAANLMGRIDAVVVADERDAQNEGMQLARKHGVEHAPFFIVRDTRGNEQVYTIYFRFLKEVLEAETSDTTSLRPNPGSGGFE